MPEAEAPATEARARLRGVEGAPPKLFLIRHKLSELWWRPLGAGYTDQLAQAGTYTKQQLASCNLRPDQDEVRPLDEVVRDFCAGGNPYVLQAIVAMGNR
jgi:hypothetical protein